MIRRFIIAVVAAFSGLFPVMAAENTIPEGGMPSHFTWGVDLLSNIDMTGSDMTSVAISGFFGYKGDYVRAAGVGASANMMMGNSGRSFPIYALFRTSFTRKPSLCFLDLRLGTSVNDVYLAGKQYGFYSHAGLGITLASGRDFSSHILIGYSFFDRHDVAVGGENMRCCNLHQATVGLGISF